MVETRTGSLLATLLAGVFALSTGVGCSDDSETGGAGGNGGEGSGGAPPGPPTGPASFSLGLLGTCIVEDTGAMWCWGWNQNGQFGTRADTQLETPRGIHELGPVKVMALSGDFGCASVSSPARVVCMGYDHGGTDGEALAGENIVELAVGDAHVCALDTDGTVQCWGQNDNGQLGDGTMQGRVTPAPVNGLSNVRHIAAAGDRTCAILDDESVSCWGDDTTAPTPVDGLNGIQVLALHRSHACAVDLTGEVICFGESGDCLADGSDTSCPNPTPVPNLTGIVDIAVGYSLACARDGDGVVYCWGENGSGQLGNGTLDDNYTPTVVALPFAATDIGVGDDHVCAYASGQVFCWGSNGNGQIGNGTTIDQLTPIEIVFGH